MAGYFGNIPTPQATQTRDTFTATSGQTSFATSGYTVGMLDVYLNGIKLASADFTASNGSDVVLASGASADDIVEVVSFSTFETNSGVFTGDFSVDSPTFKVDSSNDRVGIGTASPTSALHVSGGAGTNIAIQSSAGTHWRIGDGVGSTNGNLVIYDYSDSRKVFEIDTNGHVTMPSQSAFLVNPSSNQTDLAVNGWTTIAFGTERFDQNGDFDGVNTFTAPVTGRYQFNLFAYLTQINHGYSIVQVALQTSNLSYRWVYDFRFGDSNADYLPLTFSTLADMDASDTAYIRINIPNYSTAQMDFDASSWFSGYLVC